VTTDGQRCAASGGAGDSWLAQLGWRWADWLLLGRANWASRAGNGNGPRKGEKKIKEGRERKEKWAGWISAQEGFKAQKNGFLFSSFDSNSKPI
jgi:hypothetical protein